MKTNLIGQYVESWGDQYQEIVLVYLDRGVVRLLARNPDNNLVSYDAENCKVVEKP